MGMTLMPARSIGTRNSVSRFALGAAITAGADVQSDATGKAIPAATDVAASLATGVVGSNNAITWTARTPGTGGNSLTVTLVDPGGTTAALTVDVANNGTDIASFSIGTSRPKRDSEGKTYKDESGFTRYVADAFAGKCRTPKSQLRGRCD